MENKLELYYESEYVLLLILIVAGISSYLIWDQLIITGLILFPLGAVFYFVRKNVIIFGEDSVTIKKGVFNQRHLTFTYKEIEKIEFIKWTFQPNESMKINYYKNGQLSTTFVPLQAYFDRADELTQILTRKGILFYNKE